MALSIRFLQCSGFRFDSPAWEGPEEWIASRNQDLWKTFEDVLSLCKTENLDYLFIAGDLFEQQYVRKETVERVAQSFAKIEPTRIFIVPGARDPLVITSAYRLALWPNNVHIFPSGMSKVNIPEQNVIIYGSGWATYQQEESFLDGFQSAGDKSLQIMLLHAEVGSEKKTEGFIPILPEQISLSGLTYLGVGHQQEWGGIQQAGNTFWADSGSPEPRGFSEPGSHGVLLGKLENGSSQFQFIELTKRRYIEKSIEYQPDMESLTARLLSETSLQERQSNLFRLKLTGVLPDKQTILPLLTLLKHEFRYLELISSESEESVPTGRTVSNMAFQLREAYPTLTEVLLHKLQQRQLKAEDIQEREFWELVKKIGLAALEQGRICDEN